MTISTTSSQNNAIGSASTATYNYDFKIFADSELLVTLQTIATGTETELLTTDYTVSGAGDDLGGSITITNTAYLSGGFLPATYAIKIERVVALTQTYDVRNVGRNYPEGQENALDHNAMADQQLQRGIDRSLKVPTTETGEAGWTTADFTVLPDADVRASKYLYFDADGKPTAVASVTPAGAITLASFFSALLVTTPASFMQTFLNSATASAAMTALGITSFFKTLILTTPASFMQTFLNAATAAAARTALAFGTTAKFIVDGDIADATITGAKFAGLNLNIERKLRLVKASASTVTITATSLGVEEYLLTTVSQTLSTATTAGLGGTDVGAIATGWYAVWVLYNPTASTTSSVCTTTLTSTGPNIAAAAFTGYTKKRHVGFFYYTAGAIVQDFLQVGRYYTHMVEPPANFYSGSPTSATWTTITGSAGNTPGIECETVFHGYVQQSGGSVIHLSARPVGATYGNATGIVSTCVNNAGSGAGSGEFRLIQNTAMQVQVYLTTSTPLGVTVTGFIAPQL